MVDDSMAAVAEEGIFMDISYFRIHMNTEHLIQTRYIYINQIIIFSKFLMAVFIIII